MTLYGKILVFMNLVFALVTGAFIVTAYINRTNWKAAYDQLDKYYTVAQANADAYYAEANEAKKRADEEVKRITRDLDNAKAKGEGFSHCAGAGTSPGHQRHQLRCRAQAPPGRG
jgi:hypothetical protein